jgi:hypothetical protein
MISSVEPNNGILSRIETSEDPHDDGAQMENSSIGLLYYIICSRDSFILIRTIRFVGIGKKFTSASRWKGALITSARRPFRGVERWTPSIGALVSSFGMRLPAPFHSSVFAILDRIFFVSTPTFVAFWSRCLEATEAVAHCRSPFFIQYNTENNFKVLLP